MSSTVAPQVGIEQAEVDQSWTTAQSGSVSFPDLVRAHYQWERSGEQDGELATRWRQALAAFQADEGELRFAYWATRRPSAVALTMKERHWLIRMLADNDAVIRLHRVTDWVAKERGIADLMHHADTLAIKVSEVLRGTTERIAMQWIYSVQSHLLGFVERTQGRATDEEMAALVDSQQKELLEIEKYYARAGEKAARIVYFWGMMTGAFIDGLLAAALLGGLWATGWVNHAHGQDLETFFICYVAGGLGAIVSVLMRMTSSKFNVDYEVGRTTIRRLGSFRPFIGAVFGVALYFFVRSGIPNVKLPDGSETFYYFAAFAFLAGFNERWANVLFGKAEQTLAGRLGPSAGSTTKDDEEH
jgi:hypothetical protein